MRNPDLYCSYRTPPPPKVAQAVQLRTRAQPYQVIIGCDVPQLLGSIRTEMLLGLHLQLSVPRWISRHSRCNDNAQWVTHTLLNEPRGCGGAFRRHPISANLIISSPFRGPAFIRRCIQGKACAAIAMINRVIGMEKLKTRNKRRKCTGNVNKASRVQILRLRSLRKKRRPLSHPPLSPIGRGLVTNQHY